MPSAAQRVQAEVIVSIALFMLLAAVVTPEPTPHGVGLRGVPRRSAPRADVLRPVHTRQVEAAVCRSPRGHAAARDAVPVCAATAGLARPQLR
ncbi:MAG TPA: hypothetical protein VFX14_04555 [Methylomirabilota bacterium]|nr:hypothetical protein [Methylomirabilota bacterium]